MFNGLLQSENNCLSRGDCFSKVRIIGVISVGFFEIAGWVTAMLLGL